jgi:hypothetical protein
MVLRQLRVFKQICIRSKFIYEYSYVSGQNGCKDSALQGKVGYLAITEV